MKPSFIALVAVSGLAACGFPLPFARPAPPAAPVVAVTESPGAGVLRPHARGTAPAAPTEPARADGFLGRTLAGLGAPGEAGLWLRTGLVAAPRPGRIVAENGQSLEVELRPSGTEPGAGSQISLAALRALGLPISGLATLRVYSR